MFIKKNLNPLKLNISSLGIYEGFYVGDDVTLLPSEQEKFLKTYNFGGKYCNNFSLLYDSKMCCKFLPSPLATAFFASSIPI